MGDMTSSEKKPVTIRDVAARAQVSLATASRALTGGGYVDERTKHRVHTAASELHYRPHAAARGLRLQRSHTIGLMIADIVNPFYSHLADGVLDCAKRLRYHVILAATDEDPAMEREYLEVFLEKRVDGILAVPTGHNLSLWREALDLGIKVVLVDREIPRIPEADVVLVDNVQGAYDATSYLIGLGHRRIGIISGPTSTTTGKGRLQGYYAAHKDAHIPVDSQLVQVGTFKRETGFEAAQRLLALDPPPSAIFASNNVLGESALFALREQELKIPEDISVILFDDVPWASLTTPRLTVVAQPTHRLGVVAVEQLTQRLQEAEPTGFRRIKVVLQAELIIRESCRNVSSPLISIQG